MDVGMIENFRDITIGYLGCIGSYSGQAARFFRNNIYNLTFSSDIQDLTENRADMIIKKIVSKIRRPRIVAVPSETELVAKVKRGEIDYAVLPYETTKFGEIKDNTHLLINKDKNSPVKLKVCGMVSMPTNIGLFVAKKGVTSQDIKTLLSDRFLLRQCEDKIERLFRNQENFVAESKKEDASKIAKDLSLGLYSQTNTAVLCSRETARFYDLEEIYLNIADEFDNHTSFVLFTNNIKKNM